MAGPGMKSTADFAVGERRRAIDVTLPLSIRVELAGLVTGQPSNATPRIEGGKAPFTYSIAGDGALTVTTSGEINGTPSGASIIFSIKDANGLISSQVFTPVGGTGLPSAISAPVLTKTSAAGSNPITIDIALPDDIIHADNKLRAQRTNDESSSGVPNWAGSSLVTEVQPAGDDGSSVSFDLLTGPMPSAPNYVRFAEETGDATVSVRGSIYSPWSNVVSDNFSVGAPTLNPLTVTIGDSWYGNANPPYSGFYLGFYFANHTDRTLTNMGLGGQGLDYLRSRVNDIIAAAPYVLSVSFARNDFMNSDAFPSKQQIFDAYVAKYKSCLDDIKAGCPGIAIAVETVTERHASDGGADGSGGYNDTYNTWRIQLNNTIRAWKASGYIAQVIDIGAESYVGANGAMQPGSAMSADGLHFTEAAAGPSNSGHYHGYQVYAAAMNALYAATPLPGSSGDQDVSSFAISPTSVSHNEGNSGSTAYVFTVTRTGGLTYAAAIDYAVTGTGSNPASAADFVGGALPSGTLNFAANAATATITINVQGDADVEPDEDFLLTLTNGRTSGAISAASATGRITNDDVGGSTVGFTALTPPSFQNGASYPSLSIPSAGRFLVFFFSALGRVASTASLTPSTSGSAIAGTMKQANDALQLWEFVVPAAGNYDLAFAPAGSNFYLTGIIPVIITGASASISNLQIKPFANTNNPATSDTVLTVGSGGLGVVFSAITQNTPAITSRSDGATNRSSLYITDSGGNVNPTLLSFATMTASGTPGFTFTPDAGEPVGIIAGSY